MEREDVIKSPEYLTAGLNTALYNIAWEFMKRNNMNAAQLAEYLNVSKLSAIKILTAEFNPPVSKFYEVVLKLGVVPQMEFVPVEDYVKNKMGK